MFKYVFIASLLVSAVLAAPLTDEELELERQQNENAKYSFGTKVDDEINDGAFERTETRDGTKVTGKYSYSDGYVRRTVEYEADENGYRVVKEDMEVIGDGPQFNPDGQADIAGSLIGQYSIKLDNSDTKQHYKDIRQ
ncbi:larval cuticle protein A1A isoform X2 [Drosophila navojoa]|uniref:larval cuticle protein A1A isoform X2 n=1 Tax=Drosophila navojoa TaxID=7232 RepID=UPI0011BF4EB1|nr:larval cuticle protein A1A isoform X2 [Drosophila navojoa]